MTGIILSPCSAMDSTVPPVWGYRLASLLGWRYNFASLIWWSHHFASLLPWGHSSFILLHAVCHTATPTPCSIEDCSTFLPHKGCPPPWLYAKPYPLPLGKSLLSLTALWRTLRHCPWPAQLRTALHIIYVNPRAPLNRENGQEPPWDCIPCLRNHVLGDTVTTVRTSHLHSRSPLQTPYCISRSTWTAMLYN